MSKDQSASFMIRFTQKSYKSEDGAQNIQWRGKISHIQSGEDKGFVDFGKAVDFMQGKLSDITEENKESVKGDVQESLVTKGFDILKKFTDQAPSFVMETIKDPVGQVGHLQDAIKDQIRDVGDDISKKLDVDNIRTASRNDYKEMLTLMNAMSKQIELLTRKVESLEK